MDRQELIKVRISRVLYESGWKPFRLTAYPYQVERGNENFYSLRDLKNYYNITKTKVIDREWAISPRGKRHEWNVYEAEISIKYIKSTNRD